MAKKGAEKNTRNKALHSKLIKKKKVKLQKDKEVRKAKIYAILDKAKEAQAKSSDESVDIPKP